MTFNAFEIIFLVLLIICLIIQLLYYWIVLFKPYSYIRPLTDNDLQTPMFLPSVSIIISIIKSNNDFIRYLTEILEQNYPEFEVIVVTDEIYDSEMEILENLKKQYPNLYSTHVPKETRNVSRKKLALTLGIKASKYDKLLFTEPDSYVRSDLWIFSMARHFSDEKSIILGCSAVENAENIPQKYVVYDYFISNLQMISLAVMNHPYAGNGRNMAYSKQHFIEQRGFVKHRLLQKGEDDLFINEITTCENTVVDLTPQSMILTEMKDFRDWKRYKVDKMLTKSFYKRGPVAFWRFENFTRLVFFITFIACIIYGFPYKTMPDLLITGTALFCLITRFISQYIVINKTLEKLELEKFNITIFLFDIIQPFINLYFYIYRLFKEKENYTYRYENR